MEARFLRSADEFREWLERNHDRAQELWVGLHRKGSRQVSITYDEALDQALCFGWIDGVRRKVDADSYAVRFTPRKAASRWSEANIERARRLEAAGLMHPSGRTAFEQRDEQSARRYSRQQRDARLDSASEQAFRANKPGWRFFEAQPEGYRRLQTRWVMSAKREDTRRKRLSVLIEASEEGIRLDPMKSPYEQIAAAGRSKED